jgi:ketosteroid isomerase-like protein
MSSEENKAIARRYFEGLNKAALTIADERFSPEHVTYLPGSPPLTREGWKHAFSLCSSAFPNLTHPLADQIPAGEKVATCFPFVALLKDPFLVSLPRVSTCR